MKNIAANAEGTRTISDEGTRDIRGIEDTTEMHEGLGGITRDTKSKI